MIQRVSRGFSAPFGVSSDFLHVMEKEREKEAPGCPVGPYPLHRFSHYGFLCPIMYLLVSFL